MARCRNGVAMQKRGAPHHDLPGGRDSERSVLRLQTVPIDMFWDVLPVPPIQQLWHLHAVCFQVNLSVHCAQYTSVYVDTHCAKLHPALCSGSLCWFGCALPSIFRTSSTTSRVHASERVTLPTSQIRASCHSIQRVAPSVRTFSVDMLCIAAKRLVALARLCTCYP
jgi:hypothetical protein